MKNDPSVATPAPSPLEFRNGISHPDLWLWDSWTCWLEGELTLFCLALARQNSAGRPIAPGERNDYPFHIRRFISCDEGQSWRDCGVYLAAPARISGAVNQNIWSGSATVDNGELLFGFTGLQHCASSRQFLQTLCIATAPLDGTPPNLDDAIVLSDPMADYENIVAKGYYIAPRDMLGANAGEEGGPILAWRDPFLLPLGNGVFEVFWAAKTGPAAPAIGHGRLRKTVDGFDLEYLDPIVPPDAHAYTQAEVPKVYYDHKRGDYYLLLSTCDRLSEEQPDDEVSKELRLFKATSTTGPWRPYSNDGSVLPELDCLFGGSFTRLDFDAGQAILVAPFTEMAVPELQLTFASARQISLNQESPVSDRLVAKS